MNFANSVSFFKVLSYYWENNAIINLTQMGLIIDHY